MEQKPHSDTKLVHSGQPQVFDNKQQAPLVVIMLFINTAASVIDVCGSRADATQSVSTMLSPPVPFQRMLRAQTSYPMRPPLHKRGGTVAKSRHTCRPSEVHKGCLQAGARVKGLSGVASNDTTSKHGRLSLGIFSSSVNTAGLSKIQSHLRSSPRWGNGRSRAQRFSPHWVTVGAAPKGSIHTGVTVVAAPSA